MRTLFFTLLMIAGCSWINPGSSPNTTTADQFFKIRSRDLVEQAKTGNGEGLAKGVPGQPLLINNSTIFSSMGDAVMGIAIAVGTVSKTVELFKEMDPIPLEAQLKAALNSELEQQKENPQWHELLAQAGDTHHFILEPYCYLHGYPNARLQVRLRLSLAEGEALLWSRQLVETSEELPLKSEKKGENSWSADKGKKIIEFALLALPKLIERLPETQSDTIR